ncbi:hypothetical protein EC957_000581 [Mortierella hygrophila]|uniref:HCP-like protein n=1 Tax=Mortierella hygrophila TaxID=979708 RepID=A0A9P6F7H2_9FUNG|nr:hypothetical protein EC957_000581 [Mortierella hygrophila]
MASRIISVPSSSFTNTPSSFLTQPMLQTNITQERVQAVRPLYSSSHRFSISSVPPSDIVYITSHSDTITGEDIVLWEDIVTVFKHASYVRHEAKVLSFLKGSDFRTIEPRRILAAPNSILEVVIEGQPGLPELDAFNPTPLPMRDLNKRSPEYNPSTKNRPVSMARAPQLNGNNNNRLSNNNTDNDLYKKLPRVPHGQAEDITDIFTRAILGDASARISIAELYKEGEEVPQDYERAMEWYMQAANQGDPTAQWNVGLLFHHGLGVTEDFLKAMAWYRKAARQGYAGAQYSIARMFEYGQGVPKDESKAVEWYFKAAENGHVPAQQYLRYRRDHTNDRAMPRPHSLLLKSIE